MWAARKRKQPRLLDHDAGIGHSLARNRTLGDRLAESHTRLGPSAHFCQGPLREADQTHAVMDPAGSEAPLRNFGATTFARQDIGRRHRTFSKTTSDARSGTL
jgi:hypothetical protein